MPEMDVAEPALKRLTVDEFLAWDDGTDRRYELVAGEIVAMAPVQDAHSVIVANFAAQANARLKAPCRTRIEAGIFLAHRDDAYYQADAAISCNPTRPGIIGVIDPIVIIEVLSRSTAKHDRGLKLQDYRHIPSVQEILMLSADEIGAELWRRTGATWTVRDLTAGDRLSLESVDIAFQLDSLYQGIEFSAAAS